VQRQINKIDSLATNEENVNVVERNLTSFRVTVEEFKGSVAALLGDLETDEELNVANDWYADQSKQINDFIEKTVRWISSAKEKTVPSGVDYQNVPALKCRLHLLLGNHQRRE